MIDFTLPVTATNLLLQYHTINVAKVMTGKEGRERERERERAMAKLAKHAKRKEKEDGTHRKVESIHQVRGIDSVLMILPKNVAAKIGTIEGGSASGGD